MLFQSAGFLFIFLPAFLLVTFSLPCGLPRSSSLLIFSYLFYSGGEPSFCVILFVSSVTDYLAAIGVYSSYRKLHKRIFVVLSLSINLGLLAFFKYGAWASPHIIPFINNLSIPVPNDSYFKGFILPAGISFYTFQSMSYTIDVYMGKIRPERNFLGFCNYIAYLPQLIAGPIERFSNLYPQITAFNAGKAESYWSAGVDRIALGLIQKLIIADSCGIIVDRLLNADINHDFITAWVVSIGFGMQIYFDFAAYTHIAIGISLILGIRLQENFNSPYQACNIREFWRRWHMTLSRWFRDYLYIPLGGSREGHFRTVINILLTFLLVGLWHGAGWNYVFWGALHGCMLTCYYLKTIIFPQLRINHFIGVFITFTLVHIAWVPFRAGDISDIFVIWNAMLGKGGFNHGYVSDMDIVFVAIVTFSTLIFPNASRRWPGNSGWHESACIWLLAVFAIFNSPAINKFIYFQF